ncbi:hypothetical protein VKT23_007719 [Stygiomarasmius scandens]|uniref:Rho-GAP domain-containing protein n=1 Tax=Marasmiellus scandens TaxID=2682957 RepID=A0ABR1JJ45_9AGAR
MLDEDEEEALFEKSDMDRQNDDQEGDNGDVYSFTPKSSQLLPSLLVNALVHPIISYIDTLPDLALHVPLTQINIPPAVYQENLKHESRITPPKSPLCFVFCCVWCLVRSIMGHQGEKEPIPCVVHDCIQRLRDHGLDEEGLFRRSPASQLLPGSNE